MPVATTEPSDSNCKQVDALLDSISIYLAFVQAPFSRSPAATGHVECSYFKTHSDVPRCVPLCAAFKDAEWTRRSHSGGPLHLWSAVAARASADDGRDVDMSHGDASDSSDCDSDSDDTDEHVNRYFAAATLVFTALFDITLASEAR